jgi:hypothetical protein
MILNIQSNWEMSIAGIVVTLVCYITSEVVGRMNTTTNQLTPLLTHPLLL